MTGTLPGQVRIVEVGPRDGLQNESIPIPTERKLAFINALVAAGLREIEATSFVKPAAVPQLADASDVAKQLPDGADVTFSALVPNMKGLERAMEAGMKRIAVFTAASDTFALRNINQTIEQSMAGFVPVVNEDNGNTQYFHFSQSQPATVVVYVIVGDANHVAEHIGNTEFQLVLTIVIRRRGDIGIVPARSSVTAELDMIVIGPIVGIDLVIGR